MSMALNSVLKLESRAWHEQISNLITTEGSARYPEALVQALRHVVPFDYSVSFAYRGQERPICTFDTFTPQQRIIFVSDYLEGPYLLDPFYQVYAEQIEPGLYRMRDIAPDRFYHSEYYRSYYRRTGLAEEIGFLVALPHDMMLVVSLMRAGSSTTFSDRDVSKLRRIEPIVHASTSRHWHNLGELSGLQHTENTSYAMTDSQISQAFDNFGAGVLTPREREVVRMVLRGHSSNSIGRLFQISTGTVKIHRKNIYSKLSISSQSELFSHFISHLSGSTGTIGISNSNG